MTFDDFKGRSSNVRRRLDQTLTSYSQDCTKCIDDGNLWCPTSTYAAGYCCDGDDIGTCPRATACSDEFDLTELKYMLCPNEAGCVYDRNLAPEEDGSETLYE